MRATFDANHFRCEPLSMRTTFDAIRHKYRPHARAPRPLRTPLPCRRAPAPPRRCQELNLTAAARLDAGSARAYTELLAGPVRLTSTEGLPEIEQRHIAGVPDFHGTGMTLAYWYRHVGCGSDSSPPPPRTNRTYLVLPPVLSGHVSSLPAGRSDSCGLYIFDFRCAPGWAWWWGGPGGRARLLRAGFGRRICS
jgi:hypothetical protein